MTRFLRPVPISGRLTSPLVLAPGAVAAGVLLLQPTTDVELDDLRISFYAPSPVVPGVNVTFLIRTIRVGDNLIWNDDVGTDGRNFGADSTLRLMLHGATGSPAQPIVISGDFRNLGSAASGTAATVSATAIGRKR